MYQLSDRENEQHSQWVFVEERVKRLLKIRFWVNNTNFVFRFETERVLSIQKPSGIWTHTATMQNNLKSSKLLIFNYFINFNFILFKIKISF